MPRPSSLAIGLVARPGVPAPRLALFYRLRRRRRLSSKHSRDAASGDPSRYLHDRRPARRHPQQWQTLRRPRPHHPQPHRPMSVNPATPSCPKLVFVRNHIVAPVSLLQSHSCAVTRHNHHGIIFLRKNKGGGGACRSYARQLTIDSPRELKMAPIQGLSCDPLLSALVPARCSLASRPERLRAQKATEV